MEVVKTKLDGVLLIKPELFKDGEGEYSEDHRGIYVETFNVKKYKDHGIDVDFVEDDYSLSKKNILRGIHGDSETWKLVSCHLGEFYLAVVDCREGSKDFGKWETFTLTDKNHWQVLVPPRFGNGHLALTDKIIFNYKQSAYYNPGGPIQLPLG